MQRTTLLLFCFFIINTFGQKNLLPWVNPFIGTEKMGHTYPGATAPFGAVQLSLTPVSQKNALENMQTEIPGWDFDQFKKQTQQHWNSELNGMVIQASEEDQVNFYTA